MNLKAEKFLVAVFGIAFNIGIYVFFFVALLVLEFRVPEKVSLLEDTFILVASVAAQFWPSTVTLVLSIIYFIYIDRVPFAFRMAALLAMILAVMWTFFTFAAGA